VMFRKQRLDRLVIELPCTYVNIRLYSHGSPVRRCTRDRKRNQ
jgi:hypothetical protein